MKNLKQNVVDCLKNQGADLVGFGSANRFGDSFLSDIFPNAKTVIVAAFRVLRGSHRGIEDGSTFYMYSTMGVETIEENIMPLALMRACALLEDEGFSALPQRLWQTVMVGKNGTNPEMDYDVVMRERKTELEFDFNRAAMLCGLGEIGLHGALITPEFGPLVRLCAIVTDAEITSDPLCETHLCDHCGRCVNECPGKALSDEGKRDDWQCAAYYMGANMRKNPFLPPCAFEGDPDRLKIISGEIKLTPERAKEVIDQNVYYPPIKQGYVTSICGRACHRACYIHLEETGRLTRKSQQPFRRSTPWELPLI